MGHGLSLTPASQRRIHAVGSPKKAKTQCSEKKLVTKIFWDIEEVEYMPRGCMLYVHLMQRYIVKPFRSGPGRKRLISYKQKKLQGSASKAEDIIGDCGFKELHYPTYSFNTADFFLFKNMKTVLRGKRFELDKKLLFQEVNFL